MSGPFKIPYRQVSPLTAPLGCLLLGYSLLIFCVGWANASDGQDSFCSDVTYLSPSGAPTYIRFHFDKKYPCGRFANGDWWISPDSSGNVVLSKVTPHSVDNLNGLEVNPSSAEIQGFDYRISGYDPKLNAKTPIHIGGNTSIVKSISASKNSKKCRPCLQFAAVLTVLPRPLVDSTDYFRPGYFGNAKNLYKFSSEGFDKLPRYSKKCCSIKRLSDFRHLAKRYQGVQLDHIRGWNGRNIHPVDNMPDYGASIATDNATTILRFLFDDFEMDYKNHRQALINYLQMGIDLVTMAEGGLTWPAGGGHGNGRKLPIIFTAYVLGETEFYEILPQTVFSEDRQIYFSYISNQALYGAECSDQEYWMQIRTGRGPRDCRDPYGYIDGGGREIGEAYQFCCTAKPWKYTALAIRLMKLQNIWSNNAFLEYVDRWVSRGTWSSPDPCAAYSGNPNGYMREYGPGNNGSCIRGGGRYTKKHGANADGGYYGSEIGDQMWVAYRHRVPK